MFGRFKRKKEEPTLPEDKTDTTGEEFLAHSIQMMKLLHDQFGNYTEPLNDIKRELDPETFDAVFANIHGTTAVFALGFYSMGVPMLLYPMYGDNAEHDIPQARAMAAKTAIEAMDAPIESDPGETPRLYQLAWDLKQHENFKHAFEAGKLEGGGYCSSDSKHGWCPKQRPVEPTEGSSPEFSFGSVTFIA